MPTFGICGVLLHARPDAIGAIRDALQACPGVEVHGASDDGRMVVTVEEQDDRSVVETITAFHEITGVLSASIVYEHAEHDEPEQESAS